ncbi:MAG: enoyl-CoA hydratase/isomerase family protein, partial [Steroidobacteraceae bacterium]|nr:enoyl-CoA hydratase/isomerase family protein [Steroidobacteraceae bacterium]
LTGHSPAGGAVLALYCDRRVMATGDFRIGLNEVQVGLTPGPIIAQACRRLVGARAAERLLTTGALLTPSEALALGLVDRLAAPDQVVATALAEARELLRLPAHAYALTRSIVRADLVAMFGTDPQATIEAQALEFETLMHSDETRERLAAALAARR